MRNERGRNVREKVFYDFHSILATAKKYVAFKVADGAKGQDGSMTNWEGSDGKLPTDHAMEIQKVGFFVRPKAPEDAILLSDLAMLAHGTYLIRKGEDELKKGSLAEFFPSFAMNGTAVIDANQEFSTALLPLLQPEDWTTEPIQFEFTIPAGVTADKMEVAAVIKGIYES